MSNFGIQALMLAFPQYELMEMAEITRALGNSYRLAVLEPGSSALYGRFICSFCRITVARMAY